uniref:Uncharacterized protein n=1 Tax=Acrobeloides nanus TaxID=290746 RepID=A0A914CWB3_9BILA
MELTVIDRQILGATLLVIIVICFAAYVPVIWIFSTRTYFNRSTSYQIMIHYGILELLYMCYYVIMCLMWISNTSFGAIIGWNLVIGSYVLGVVAFIFYLIPGFRAEMTANGIIRDYYNEYYVLSIFLYIVLTSYGIAYFFYLIAFGSLIRVKTSVDNRLLNKYEMSLFIQSLIICGYWSLTGLLWTYYSAPNKLMYCLFWIFTVIQNGYNPFMYYAMNKKLRGEVHALLGNMRTFGATVGISPENS